MAVRATASRSALAKVLGIASSTLRAYAQEEGFPDVVGEGGKEQEFEVRAVVLWWLVNKASKSVRQNLFEQLSEALGAEIDTPWTAKDERELLDLQLKEADVLSKLRQLVRVSDLTSHMQRFAAKLSDALESVEQTSGQPVRGIVEPVFDSFYADLKKLVGDRS